MEFIAKRCQLKKDAYTSLNILVFPTHRYRDQTFGSHREQVLAQSNTAPRAAMFIRRQG